MAPSAVTMPQLGETVTEGTLTRWLLRVGERVTVGQAFFEVATDKVDTEVPSSFTGEVIEILVQEGETVPVGHTLALVRGADDDVTASTQLSAECTPEEPARISQSAKGRPPRGTVSAPPGAPKLSPVVRRLLQEHGLEATSVQGSTADGRITRDDVLAEVERRASSSASGITADPAVSLMPEPRRAGTAIDSGQFTIALLVDFNAVDGARDQQREVPTRGTFVVRALLEVLRADPRFIDVEASTLRLTSVCADGSQRQADVPQASALRVSGLMRALCNAEELPAGRSLDEVAASILVGVPGTVGGDGVTLLVSIFDVRERPAAIALGTGEPALAIRKVGTLSLSACRPELGDAEAAALLIRVRDVLEQRAWSSTTS